MISIHAPARGATYAAGTITETEKFQSTLPRGERPVPISTQRFPRRISIHAPARGATRPCRVIHHNAASFQSTLPRGERPSPAGFICVDRGFQSTLPRGERRDPDIKKHKITDFNPRSREGSDGVRGLGNENGKIISIHAPARGATFSWRVYIPGR